MSTETETQTETDTDTWARALEQGKLTGQKPSLPGRPANDWETLYWGAEAT